MRSLLLTPFVWLSAAWLACASDSALVQVYQPLDGQASGEVIILPVAGYVTFGTSGFPFDVALVVAKNIPPNDSKQPIENLNVAFEAGIKMGVDEDETGRFILELDLTGLQVSDTFICTAEEIVGATLECMRLTAGAKRLGQMTLKTKLKPTGQENLAKVIARFQKHPKTKAFPWKAPESR